MRTFRTLGLKRFILVTTALIALAATLVTAFLHSTLYHRLLHEQAAHEAAGISRQVFNSMNQLMQLGWTQEQLSVFLASVHDSFKGTPIRVELHRGEQVDALYGLMYQPYRDQAVNRVFATGETQVLETAHVHRFLYPIKAVQSCLRCHTNAVPGDVLGVVDVRQDMNAVHAPLERQQLWLLVGTSGVALVLAGLMAAFVTRRIGRAVHTLETQVERTNAMQDLQTLQPQTLDLGFTEFNQVMDRFGHLADKLRTVAVDKEVLEFELRLLDRFIITPRVVRNWRASVRRLLRKTNAVLHVPMLFTLFQNEDGGLELDLFWYQAPSDETRKRFEAATVGQTQPTPPGGTTPEVAVQHHVLFPDADLPPLAPDALEVVTHSLQLDKPSIHGTVGLGVAPELARDPARRVVLEAILATLINTVGSVKAVHRYTRDLEYYATRDALTQLYNQRVFWELLDYEVRRTASRDSRFGLLLLDIDNFKALNDRYGHTIGDRFLAHVADVLKAAVRNEDVVARYGGDEFAIILPNTDAPAALQRARQMMQRLDTLPMSLPDGGRLRATVSVGIAVYPQHGRNARDLFLIADNMMYGAKHEGKNVALLPGEGDVADAFKEAGDIGLALMTALENPDVIEPYFQPIVARDPAAPPIHEVLMRLRHHGELLPAGRFIEVAEQIGVLHRLDDLLLEKALARVHATGYRGRLFINLSPKSLLVGEFIRKVRGLVMRYGIDPRQIVFEITERETVRNLDLLERFVYALQKEGFKFAVDDFGSGFSSLQYIKRFPIDFLKIEGDFVRNMVHDARDRALVQSATQLAREFGIATVAEFVEDATTLDAIWAMGIDYAQGYHTGHPAPEFARLR